MHAVSRLIADLTLDEFRRLAPINSLAPPAPTPPPLAATTTPTGDGGAKAGGGGAPPPPPPSSSTSSGASAADALPLPLGGAASPAGGSPTASSTSASSMSASSGGRLLRKHRNGEPAVAGEATLRAWACAEEDQLPTLDEASERALPSCLPTFLSFFPLSFLLLVSCLLSLARSGIACLPPPHPRPPLRAPTPRTPPPPTPAAGVCGAAPPRRIRH